MPDPEELREKIKRVAMLKELNTARSAALETPVSDPTGMRQFIHELPEPRRWFVSRVYEQPARDSYVDLYFAPASELGKVALAEVNPESVSEIAEDDPSWWKGEEFDLTFHIRLSDLRTLLDEYGGYPPDQPLVEGMVFIELPRTEGPVFVSFTYQAREASKKVYKRLIS